VVASNTPVVIVVTTVVVATIAQKDEEEAHTRTAMVNKQASLRGLYEQKKL
jgi:hypothetical protein